MPRAAQPIAGEARKVPVIGLTIRAYWAIPVLGPTNNLIGIIVLGEVHLRQILKSCARYYAILGGLHHHYARA